MKKHYYFLIAFSLCLLTSCQNDHDSKPVMAACGVKDPAKNIPWLKDLIAKLEDDRINKTYGGRYMGTIYLEMFEGKEVFYYYEPLSSCAFCSVYYCDGSSVNLDNNQLTVFVTNLKKNKVIYTNLPW